ncbi:hypothetical protein [Sedimentibacter saalensis]|uniref:Uncharacterized protein n=1 Tax=Sedimentibacter saalensis TaxID=130788 RepID=A0A562JHB5_9FIRM|nr:hypothetical protein [Sedimentibacter saalensis]TWH82568.1 hypothetical protein LY60_00869 [Sedimentibacter saalensis]
MHNDLIKIIEVILKIIFLILQGTPSAEATQMFATKYNFSFEDLWKALPDNWK